MRSDQRSKFEIKYLAQGRKHGGRSGARTYSVDGLVILSPAIFRKTPRTLIHNDNDKKYTIFLISAIVLIGIDSGIYEPPTIKIDLCWMTRIQNFKLFEKKCQLFFEKKN